MEMQKPDFTLAVIAILADQGQQALQKKGEESWKKRSIWGNFHARGSHLEILGFDLLVLVNVKILEEQM